MLAAERCDESCGKTQNAFVSPQGRELKEHGMSLFPVGFYLDDLERDYVPWHWHDELEMVVVYTGVSEVCAGSERYELHDGQGFFINAGVPHYMHGVTGTHCSYHSVVFHPRLIGGGIDSVFWQKYLRPLTGSRTFKSLPLTGEEEWHAAVLDAIESAWQAGAVEEPGYEFRVRAALSEAIFQLFEHLPSTHERKSEKAARDGERIKRMLRFIEDHVSDEITVADIAANAMISPTECLRCFKATVGMPPLQYVRQYRVQKASEMLSSTDMRIADIADACGFQDNSYFTRTFRTLRGQTPAEYRRERSKG